MVGTVPRMAARIRPKVMPPIFLQEWREAKDLTQEELGARIGPAPGVSGVTVGRWENWRDKKKGRRPDLNALAAIAEALGVHLRDLYRHPDQPSADDLLRGQPPEVVDNALKMIRAIRRG